MKTEKTTGSAFLNVNSKHTRYLLRVPSTNKFIGSFVSHSWDYALCDREDDAMTFRSMTQALCVGFCLGFGQDMEAIAYDDRQPELPLQRH